MGRLMDIMVNRTVDYLASEGQRIAREAAATKTTGNVTYNQKDAFGYVVYFNGAVKRMGYAYPAEMSKKKHRGWKEGGIPDGTGRQWLDMFVKEYTPRDMVARGFALVVVNAAYYTSFQDQSYPGTMAKYRVISQIYGSLDNIAAKLKGKVKAL